MLAICYQLPIGLAFSKVANYSAYVRRKRNNWLLKSEADEHLIVCLAYQNIIETVLERSNES
jgi:hypothetical protein